MGMKNFLSAAPKAFAAALCAVWALFAAWSGAAAANVSALSATDLERVLSDAGLEAEIGEDADTGGPVARAQLGEILFWVRGLDCTDAGCATLMFFANFELGRSPTSNDLAIVNLFNERQVFGRAYLIEDIAEVGVDYVIELDGGVSPEHVSANVSRWADVVAAFIEHFQNESADS
ncbi:MAG: YbjN domain-containing protein [Pseudomonadota bacterium]